MIKADTLLLRVAPRLSVVLLLGRLLLLPVQVPTQAGVVEEVGARLALSAADAGLLLLMRGTGLASLAAGAVLEGSNILVSTLSMPSCLMDSALHRHDLPVSLANRSSFVSLQPGGGTRSSGVVYCYVGLVFRRCRRVVDTLLRLLVERDVCTCIQTKSKGRNSVSITSVGGSGLALSAAGSLVVGAEGVGTCLHVGTSLVKAGFGVACEWI